MRPATGPSNSPEEKRQAPAPTDGRARVSGKAERVPHVRPSVRGTKEGGRSPPSLLCFFFSHARRSAGRDRDNCLQGEVCLSRSVKAMETNHDRPTYPGFPVEVGGVVQLHAALLTESRTRGRICCCVTGNPCTLGRTWGTIRFATTLLLPSPATAATHLTAGEPRSGAARSRPSNSPRGRKEPV